MEKEPFVVKIHDVHIEEEYVEWVNVLKTTYRKSQIRAAVKVNSEKLLWNWQLGRDLVQRKAEERWGTGIVEQLSLDLQAEFPDEKGFSTSNISTSKITAPGNQLYTKLCNKYVANFTSLMRRENQQIQLMLILCYPVI